MPALPYVSVLPLWSRLKWPLIALALVVLFNFAFTPGFFHLELRDGRLYGSLIDVINRAAPVMLLSIGMTLVIATGGVDLSVGAVMAIAGAVAALLVSKGANVLTVVLPVALGTALLLGAWNGLLVAFLEVQPIVATLILMVAGRGLAQLLTGGQIIAFENKPFQFIGGGSLFGLPFTVSLVALVFAATALFSRRTAAGLFIEAA